MAGGDDLINKVRPVVRPFLFQNGNEHQVKLIQERTLGAVGFRLIAARGLDDKLHNKVTYT